MIPRPAIRLAALAAALSAAWAGAEPAAAQSEPIRSDRLETGAISSDGRRSGLGETRTAEEIEHGVDETLLAIFEARPETRAVFSAAKGLLVFPEIAEASVIIGGAYGEGALVVRGKTRSYWAYRAASMGLQIGAQTMRLVIFFMTDDALERFLAAAPEDVAFGADLEWTLDTQGAALGDGPFDPTAEVIIAPFNRQGLLGGASLQGAQYRQIDR